MKTALAPESAEEGQAICFKAFWAVPSAGMRFTEERRITEGQVVVCETLSIIDAPARMAAVLEERGSATMSRRKQATYGPQ